LDWERGAVSRKSFTRRRGDAEKEKADSVEIGKAVSGGDREQKSSEQ